MTGSVVDKVAAKAKRVLGERLVAGKFSGSMSTTSPLIAVVSRSADTLADTLKRPLIEGLAGIADLRGLVETGGDLHFPSNAEDIGSVYLCNTLGVFDQVILDESLSLLVSPWSRTIYTHLYRLVRPGGRLILPVWGGAESRKFGRWTSSDISQHFGLEPERLSGVDFVSVERCARIPADNASIVGWFVQNAPSILMQHAFLTATDTEFRTNYETVLALSEPAELANHGIASLSQRLSKIADQHRYYVGGISYKAPLVSHIIRTHVEKSDGLRLVDMGGGYGLLAAELALDPDLKAECAICTDISELNAQLAACLYADFGERLAGKFGFHCKAAQDYEYDEPHDAVSFVGSLLYVPKDQVDDTLAQAWDAVAPGGVLIVHENIKHPRFEKDYDKMFTVPEIDALLGQFGEVHRYASTYKQPLTKQQTGEKTVFRVVVKAD